MIVTGYEQRRPYVTPVRLDELSGPTHGVVDLPVHLAWSGRRRYDLDDAADLAVLYERVIVEATGPEDLGLLAAVRLRAVWPRLFLPHRVRALWQARFPELTAAA